jgi:hypothetical protein
MENNNSRKRVTIYKNGSKANGKVLFAPDNWQELLSVCSEKLQSKLSINRIVSVVVAKIAPPPYHDKSPIV